MLKFNTYTFLFCSICLLIKLIKMNQYNSQSSEEIWKTKTKYFSIIENNDSNALIELMASLNCKSWEFIDSEGNTALILACNLDLYSIVKTLLEVVSTKLAEDGNSNPNSIKEWINTKADNGFNALHYAAYRGNIRIIKLLYSYGCTISIKNDNGLNVMHLSAQGNQISAMVYFNEFHKYSYSCFDNANSTPLHWAAYSGSSEALDFLLSRGVNINLQDNDGSTPLHLAVLTERHKIVSKLIKQGANYHFKDSNGKKPIDIALFKGDEIMMEFIQEKTNFFNKHFYPGNSGTWKFVIFVCLLMFVNEAFAFLVVIKGKL